MAQKNALYMKKASPFPQEGEKGPTNRLFSRGTRQAPTLAAPLRAPMSECDCKIHNIYSTLIYSKIHSRMHPIELFLKNFSEEHTLESSGNEIEQCCICTVPSDNASGMYYNTSHYLKNDPPPII